MGTLTIDKLTATIGAEVRDLRLVDALDDPAAQAAVRDALYEHQVLTFRGQFLDDDTHVAVASFFGEPQVHPIARTLGITSPVEQIVDSATKLPDREGWHTDAPFLACPPSVAVLRAITVPPTGGDTLWASMTAAYEALSPAMRRIVDGLQVAYPPQQGLFDYVQEHLGADIAAQVRELVGNGAVHPLVCTHARTGRRTLYFARGFAGSIVDMHADESALLFPYLDALAARPGIQCRWRWQEGDVVMWDERATQHSGAADHRGADRELRRVLVSGDAPR
jgi:taurine dioxygenase